MRYTKISLGLALFCIIGILVSSYTYIFKSPPAFVFSSWIKPFSAMGFIIAGGYYYLNLIKRIHLRKSIFILFLSGVAFGFSFLILLTLAPFSAEIINSFKGIHSCVLFPSLLSAIFLTAVISTRKFHFLPIMHFHESVATALLPFYLAVLLSVILAPVRFENPRAYWLTHEYFDKPAVFHPINTRGEKYPEDTLYTGPLKITYSTDFIRLYRKLQESPEKYFHGNGKSEITDYAEFAGHYFLVLSDKASHVLLIFDSKSNLIRRFQNIKNIYHSDLTLTAVDNEKKEIIVFNTALEEMYKIPFASTLTVKKIVFSENLFAILYKKSDRSVLRPATFCNIYRLDTGSRTGNVKAADIAPKLKRPGFIAVENSDKGLYIVVLDRNSNKRGYLFNKTYFGTVKIRQCGNDKFFIKAYSTEADKQSEVYMLIYDFHRYRKILERTIEEKTPNDRDDIIAIVNNYFITKSKVLSSSNLRVDFEFDELSTIPYRVIPSPKKSLLLRAEGSIKEIDFNPLFTGFAKKPKLNLLLTDIKNNLIIKKITKLGDYYLLTTNNRVYIYNDTLEVLREIDFLQGGFIRNVSTFKKGVVVTYQKDDDIFIYLIGNDLSKNLITQFNRYKGTIWDVSVNAIVYGNELVLTGKIGSFNEPGILIAKFFGSGTVYHKRLLTQLKGKPFLQGNRLFLSYEHLTEVVDLHTGKRRVVRGGITKVGNKSYGLVDEKHFIELSTLNMLPYNLNPDKIGRTITSENDWIDLQGYVVNVDNETFYEVIRTGITHLGNSSICSITKSRKNNLISCFDIANKTNLANFHVKKDYQIIYSDTKMLFLKDNHSLITTRIGK